MAASLTRQVARVLLLLCLLCGTFAADDAVISPAQLLRAREQVRGMFFHAFNSYMDHAFPADELKPISCTGRRREGRGTLDDVFGGYPLTLIDAADTLAVMGAWDAFEKAVWDIHRHVSFDRDVEVSLFETTIRALGGLLSVHLAAVEHQRPANYTTELLDLALDLGNRLIPVFETPTGIPLNKANLRFSVPRAALWPPSRAANADLWETCLACGGTLLLEFGMLSRLTGDDRFEEAARTALDSIWARRSARNLLGNVINSHSGAWTWSYAHIGAGSDSYYETLLKAYSLFDDSALYGMFNSSYHATHRHAYEGWFVPVDMHSGAPRASWVDSLGAFWPGLQALAGDLHAARTLFERYEALWTRFGALPERFDIASDQPVLGMAYYPLRPELAESAYILYQATRDPHYIRVGMRIMQSLEQSAKVKCGYASIANVNMNPKTLDDRMDSYFLSEVCKYLYLLFDPTNNYTLQRYVFTTEGHPFPREFATLDSRRHVRSDAVLPPAVPSSQREVTPSPSSSSASPAQPHIDSGSDGFTLQYPSCASSNRTIRPQFPPWDVHPQAAGARSAAKASEPPHHASGSGSGQPHAGSALNPALVSLLLHGVSKDFLSQVAVQFVPAHAELLLTVATTSSAPETERAGGSGSTIATTTRLLLYGLLGDDMRHPPLLQHDHQFILVVAEPLDSCASPPVVGDDDDGYDAYNDKQVSGPLTAVITMRGNCTFAQKIRHAQHRYGADFVIVINYDRASPIFQMTLNSNSDNVVGGGGEDDIPATMISWEDGQQLLALFAHKAAPSSSHTPSSAPTLQLSYRNRGEFHAYGGNALQFLLRTPTRAQADALRARAPADRPAFFLGDFLTLDTNAVSASAGFRRMMKKLQASAAGAAASSVQIMFNILLSSPVADSKATEPVTIEFASTV